MSNWLISIGHNFIRWPEGNEINKAKLLFEALYSIPGVLGVIDVTHIKIRRPSEDGQDYFDRNKNYSLSLQGVVGLEKKFYDIFCGEPGSLHDARILRRSVMYVRVRSC